MRCSGGGPLALILTLTLGLALGCTEAAPEPPSEDVLVLELGGPNASLQGALRAIDARSAPAEAPLREVPAPPIESVPIEPPAEPPPAEERWVELQQGQTISDLAAEHLGSSRRFVEILELNGWDDQRARKLRIGTRVRLPAQ